MLKANLSGQMSSLARLFTILLNFKMINLMKIGLIRLFFALSFSYLLLSTNQLKAQENDKASSVQPLTDLERFEKGVAAFNWNNSINPMALGLGKLQNFATAGFKFDQQQGRFKRPQEALKLRHLGFGAKGFNRFKAWSFYGEFGYNRLKRDSVNFANVARPYDGNPFITADSIGGNWSGDQLNAKLQVAYPNLGKLRLATHLDYLTEQANRRNDPRPLYRYLDAQLSQSFGFQWNKSSVIALSAGYRRKVEDVETGQLTITNYKLYSLRGYGTNDYVPVVSALRHTAAYGWNIGASYLFETEKSAFFVQSNFSYLTEDVEDGSVRNPNTQILEPILVGGYDELKYSFAAGYQRKLTENKGWSIALNSQIIDGTGYDPRFNGVNPSLYLATVQANFSYWNIIFNNSWLKLSYLPAWQSINYNEVIAKTDWLVTKLKQDLALSWIKQCNKKWSLELSPLVGYHFPLSGQIVINRPTTISNLLVRPDFEFANTSYLKSSFTAGCTLKTATLTYRLSGNFTQLNTFNAENRNNLHCSFQLLF
jgi:hypothetical protein